jgi:hypothetical protein
MAGRTFYQAADGSLTRAAKVRHHNAVLRAGKKTGQMVVTNSNFGTAGKDKGEIEAGRAADVVKNGDIIAIKGKDGKVERVKVTAANRDAVLGRKEGTLKPTFRPVQSDFGKAGVALKRGSERVFGGGKEKKSRGQGSGKAPRFPKGFGIMSPKNQQAALGNKPLKSKKQVALRTKQLRKKEKVRRNKEKAVARKAAKKNNK